MNRINRSLEWHKWKNILLKSFSIYLIFSILSPSLLKLEHHHEHFVCHAKQEKHIHSWHPKCEVCDFEFSFFAEHNAIISFDAQPIYVEKTVEIQQRVDLQNPIYTFLLRAPPANFI